MGKFPRLTCILGVVAVLMSLVTFFPPLSTANEIIPPEALQCDPVTMDTPDVLYFSETCFQVKGDFKFNWERSGLDLGYEGVYRDEAVMLSGFPLTRNFDYEGLHIQAYERTVLEYHPENEGTEFVILRRLLGKELFDQRKDQWGADVIGPATPINDSSCQYFPETQHNMCGGLLDYWNNNGGLMAFGYPLMEASFETMPDGSKVWVQYTERQRFEWHENNPDPWKVLLGRLGAEFIDARTGGGTNPVNCEPQIFTHEPRPEETWDLEGGSDVYRVVNFWTNWTGQNQEEVKLLLNPGENVILGGGGSMAVFSSNCGNIANQRFQEADLRETSLQELYDRGLVQYKD
jgi:hypothetical protein